MATRVKGDERISSFCTFDLPGSTAVRCTVSESDGVDHWVTLVLGDGSIQGEVALDMPVSLVGVVLAQLRKAVMEIQAAQRAEDEEAVACVANG